MGDTAAATIEEAIEGYKAHDPDRVLSQFHEEAVVVGTREDEHWTSREEMSEALARELEMVEVEGPLTETGAEESFIRQASENVAIYTRDGYVTFNGKRVRGRWSAVLRSDEDDWKIVNSHFSLAEGHTTPDGVSTKCRPPTIFPAHTVATTSEALQRGAVVLSAGPQLRNLHTAICCRRRIRRGSSVSLERRGRSL